MSFTSFIYKFLYNTTPWADEQVVDGKLVIKDYNSAFVESLRARFAEELQGAVKTGPEVVQLYIDRYNYEQETPRLEVVHGEIAEDGRVNVKLEWNDAFIRMLRDAGVEGSTEDDMIKVYLATVTARVDREIAAAEDEADTALEAEQGSSKRAPSEVDVAAIIDHMEPDVLKMFEKDIRRRASKRRKAS